MIDLILAAALAALSPAEHADLTCNELAINVLAGPAPDGPVKSTAQALNLFYVGRLSARDGSMDWNARTIAQMKTEPLTQESAKAASVGCMQRMRTSFGAAAKPK